MNPGSCRFRRRRRTYDGTLVNIVDWVLIGAVIAFGIAGWRRGFVAGVLSFAGFLGGGLLAAFILPPIVATTGLSDIARGFVVAGGVLVLALAGQFGASILGSILRGSMTWQPVRLVDNAGGAALNILALAIVTWIIASAIAYLPATAVSTQMTQSRVLVALDSIVPPAVRNAFGSLRDLVASTDVPRVFSGLAQVTGPEVAAPDASVDAPPIGAVRGSIVRVSGDTPECKAAVTGSGFAFGPDRILTNAHVVAGVDKPVIQVRLGDPGLAATVVYFDPEADIAVLDVPGLDARPLQFTSDPAQSGDSAVIAGFPIGGSFRAEPARVRTVVDARGDNIYGRAGVDREVYVVRGTVLPGNSGGPLLDLDGRAMGMVFGADEQQASIGYAMTAAQLAPAVQASASLTDEVDTGTCRLRY